MTGHRWLGGTVRAAAAGKARECRRGESPRFSDTKCLSQGREAPGIELRCRQGLPLSSHWPWLSVLRSVDNELLSGFCVRWGDLRPSSVHLSLRALHWRRHWLSGGGMCGQGPRVPFLKSSALSEACDSDCVCCVVTGICHQLFSKKPSLSLGPPFFPLILGTLDQPLVV